MLRRMPRGGGPFAPQALRSRAHGATLLLAALIVLLLGALFDLQVVEDDGWRLKAKANYVRQVAVPAPRGVIYDRDGRILADNVPGYAVTLLPGPADSVRATLVRLATVLGLGVDEVGALFEQVRRYGREVLVDGDVDFETASVLIETSSDLPRVVVEMRPRRRYPAGRATSHVLGYVGRVSKEEAASWVGPAPSGPEVLVGKDGIERQYDTLLRGRDGIRTVEIDARGRIVGEFLGRPFRAPESGRDIHLTLDLELQEWIARSFPDGLAGTVIALDPADGGILALYSAPTFEPEGFIGGISRRTWGGLVTDPQRPLVNRAIQGLYPPASPWKLATAAVALKLGVVSAFEHMPEACPGTFLWGGRTWRCWLGSGHGDNDLLEAIGNSCDVYFYQLGLRVGLDRLLAGIAELGFAGPTGVDLPGEVSGVFPEDRTYWLRRFGQAAGEGEVLSLVIGQGPDAQTPLRMTQFFEALARGGAAPAPFLARGAEPGPAWDLRLARRDIDVLMEGLRRVTGPGGTAHMDATLELWDVVGKTGTAQNTASLRGSGKNDAWFVAIAGPFDAPPEIVVLALVEQGGSGSAVAAPLAVKAADFYLRRAHGIPHDSVQTLREWVSTRGWPQWYRDRFPEAGGS